jgi:hypothetical protein
MATVNALCTMYHRIGFDVAPTMSISNNQDVNSLDKLKILRDDEITNLCRALRESGGLIPKTNAADLSQPVMIPDPGTSEKDSTCISPFVHPNMHVITYSSFMWPEMHASTEAFTWFLYVCTPLVTASQNLFPRGQKVALTSLLIHAN